jgi:TonB family protein
VQARLKYPKYAQENVITGRVIVDVIIEKDGTLTVAGFKQLAHEVLAAEVERVVKTSPKWEPGSNKGKPVRVQFSVPFNFQIRNGGPVNNANKGNDEDQPLMKAEILPSFQGGHLNAYRSWVESEVVYPKKLLRKKIGGRVTVEFIIDKDGSVIFSKIMQSPHELLSAEVERVIKSSPKWSPGKQRGEPVIVKMQLPVEFTAPQKSKK